MLPGYKPSVAQVEPRIATGRDAQDRPTATYGPGFRVDGVVALASLSDLQIAEQQGTVVGAVLRVAKGTNVKTGARVTIDSTGDPLDGVYDVTGVRRNELDWRCLLTRTVVGGVG